MATAHRRFAIAVGDLCARSYVAQGFSPAILRAVPSLGIGHPPKPSSSNRSTST
jgi:hypothetical protein